VVARPGHIYGPSIKENDSRVSAEFTRCAVNHKHLVLKSSGLQLRSYCYTLDCGSAILSILLNGYSGNAYNISNKDSIVTIRKLAELFSSAAHVPVIFKDSSNKEKKAFNMMDNSSLNSNKLESLGWKPCFDIQRGIIATLRYYR
jgi:nucleoside-diphosphate-sugar epimerase